jgi:hypothetical protein
MYFYNKMEMIEKTGVTGVKKTGINGLFVCIWFCALLFFVSGRSPLYRLCKETNRNEEALKSAQQINFPSPITGVIRDETWQLTYNCQREKKVPALESRTNIEPLTTGQQAGRDKFSDTAPKTFAPP